MLATSFTLAYGQQVSHCKDEKDCSRHLIFFEQLIAHHARFELTVHYCQNTTCVALLSLHLNFIPLCVIEKVHQVFFTAHVIHPPGIGSQGSYHELLRYSDVHNSHKGCDSLQEVGAHN